MHENDRDQHVCNDPVVVMFDCVVAWCSSLSMRLLLYYTVYKGKTEFVLCMRTRTGFLADVGVCAYKTRGSTSLHDNRQPSTSCHLPLPIPVFMVAKSEQQWKKKTWRNMAVGSGGNVC